MIRAHIIVKWVCAKTIVAGKVVAAKAVFAWKMVTLAHFNALPHLTQDMILIKAAKLVAAGAITVCAGTSMIVVQHIGAADYRSPSPGYERLAGGGSARAVISTPEPPASVPFGVATVALMVIRFRRARG